MFGITHHDIWWAKEHAWTIITYLVGVVVTLVVVDMKELTLAERDALGVLYTATALLAILYAGRMQSDMAVARIRSSFLVHHTPSLGAVVERLVGTDRDYYRGSAFMLALALLCAGASSIAVAVLKKETELGWYSYGFLGICSLASLHGQVAYRALKARKGLFAKPLKN